MTSDSVTMITLCQNKLAMKYFFTTSWGLFRLLSFLEGTSLLFLIFIAMPAKYIWQLPIFSAIIGPIHGVLFILFVLATLYFSVQKDWKFIKITLPVLLACIIPFGTFYIDHAILKNQE